MTKVTFENLKREQCIVLRLFWKGWVTSQWGVRLSALPMSFSVYMEAAVAVAWSN